MTDASGSSYSGKHVFVTGGTGVVGGWLVKSLLGLGAEVVVLIRDEPKQAELFRSGDILRVDRVRPDFGSDPCCSGSWATMRLMSYSTGLCSTEVLSARRDPFVTMELNVRGTYALLEAVRRVHKAPAVVVASSDKAYGSSTVLPYTETHPLAGKDVYEASKSAADLLATAYAGSFRLPLAIARCGNIYGGGDLNWERIVPGCIRSLLSGERPLIRSDGTPGRDYIFVADAVSAYLRLGEFAETMGSYGEAFNFGHGRAVSVLEIVHQLQRIVGREDLRAHDPC